MPRPLVQSRWSSDAASFPLLASVENSGFLPQSASPLKAATCYGLLRPMLRVRHRKCPMFMQVVTLLRVWPPKRVDPIILILLIILILTRA